MQNKPIYVSGYVRNRRIPVKQDNSKVGVVLLAGAMILVLCVYWQFTLTTAAGVSLTTFAYKYHKFLNSSNRLVINDYSQGQVQTFVHNFKEMLRG